MWTSNQQSEDPGFDPRRGCVVLSSSDPAVTSHLCRYRKGKFDLVVVSFLLQKKEKNYKRRKNCVEHQFLTWQQLVWPVIFFVEAKKKKYWMHWPGIEPGPPAWQARILPLNHQCFHTHHAHEFVQELYHGLTQSATCLLFLSTDLGFLVQLSVYVSWWCKQMRNFLFGEIFFLFYFQVVTVKSQIFVRYIILYFCTFEKSAKFSTGWNLFLSWGHRISM